MPMLGMFAAGIIITAVVAGAMLVVLRSTTPPAPAADLDQRRLVVDAYRRARVRALTCVGVASVALVAGAVIDQRRPELLGLPLALSPGLAAAAALLAFAVVPTTVDPGVGPTSASLTPRTAGSFGSRRSFVTPAAVAVAFLAFLAWAAWIAGPDDQGRLRAVSFVDGPLSSTSSPFPGTFYGLPLAVVTVLLAATTYLALRRIATTPSLPVPMLAEQDQGWRISSTRVVIRVATAALLGYFGATAAFAGVTYRSAASALVLNGGADHGVVAGACLAVAGVALVLAGVGVAVSAVVGAVTLRANAPHTLRATGTPAPSPLA